MLKTLITGWLLVWLTGSFSVSAQSELERLVHQSEAKFPQQTLLEQELSNPALSEDIIHYKTFELNDDVITNARQRDLKSMSLRIPTTDGDYDLLLIEQTITSEGYFIETNNRQVYANQASGKHYRGIIENKAGSFAAVSVFEDEIMITASTKERGNIIIGKLHNSDEYISYFEDQLRVSPNMECGVDESYSQRNILPEDLIPDETGRMGGNCVNVHIEANYEMYTREGSSVSATISYIEGMFNVVATLYANDGMDINLSYLNVWSDSNDPFSDVNSNDGLASIENYFGAGAIMNGDLAHLVSGGTGNNGGLAWVNVLCNSNITRRTAYSNIYGNSNPYPTYSWDVEVFAHEMGHNVASRHTHACVWNGNNTQIDDCGNKYVADNGNTPEGNACYNANSPIIPNGVGGTIMSYCHLQSAGINFTNGFLSIRSIPTHLRTNKF